MKHILFIGGPWDGKLTSIRDMGDVYSVPVIEPIAAVFKPIAEASVHYRVHHYRIHGIRTFGNQTLWVGYDADYDVHEALASLFERYSRYAAEVNSDND